MTRRTAVLAAVLGLLAAGVAATPVLRAQDEAAAQADGEATVPERVTALRYVLPFIGHVPYPANGEAIVVYVPDADVSITSDPTGITVGRGDRVGALARVLRSAGATRDPFEPEEIQVPRTLGTRAVELLRAEEVAGRARAALAAELTASGAARRQ